MTQTQPKQVAIDAIKNQELLVSCRVEPFVNLIKIASIEISKTNNVDEMLVAIKAVRERMQHLADAFDGYVTYLQAVEQTLNESQSDNE